jgi:nicotinamidase-related amidase
MSRSAFLVMDVINDLVHPDGPNAKGYAAQATARGLLSKIRTALEKARAAGITIGYVRVGFSSDYRECPPASPIFSRAREAGLFKLGTWGTEVHADIAPRPEDLDIVKHRVSPFYGTHLDPMLSAKSIERLYLCGISTNGVVQAAVREGHDRDFECVLLEDCCCGATEDEHAFALAGLRRFATVTTSADVSFS